MRVVLFNGNRLSKLMLPRKVEGSFWLTDELNGNSNIINIEAQNGKWILKKNDEVKILFNNSYVDSIQLEPNYFCFLEQNGKKKLAYIEETIDNTIKYYKIGENTTITLGKDSTQDILYENPYILNNYVKLTYSNEGWIINIANTSNVYINNALLTTLNKKLNYGDTLFILGIKITLYNGMISINNPSNFVTLNNKFQEVSFKNNLYVEKNNVESDQIKEIDFYTDDDYFFKKPRLRRFIEEYELTMTPPPKKAEKEKMPILLTLGPALTMGVVSVITLVNAITRMFTGNQNLTQSIPGLITSGATLLSSLLWPNLTKKYQKRQEKKQEKERQVKYREYLEKKKKEIYDVSIEQSQILKENLLTSEECQSIILKKKRNLWERRIDQQDFLTVRVGTGKVPLQLKVDFSEADFTMEKEDELKTEAEKLVNSSKVLQNVPVGYSFYNKKATAIMGNKNEVLPFMDNIILQLLAFHSFDDLKIVFFVSKENLNTWNKYKEIPHVFSNNKQVRFFATDIEEIKYISSYLEQELFNRVANNESVIENENKDNENTYLPNYLIITDDYPMIRKVGIIDKILSTKQNFGFNMAVIENRLGKLPSECVNFISLEGNATILSTEIDNYSQQDFNKEINNNLSIEECCKTLSNIPIEFTEDIRNLPTSLGFLEMYNVGKVEQLNSLNRWRLNDPIKTLRAQVGINDQGNPIWLDLHEKYHGPHGLIAGTTGSGKSEFIITYILSMIINYSPNEVAFILIDYKGGGLAGAFENKTQGIRLPHLAGTITNLDKASLNRTLVSINSELTRRQAKFNEVRDKLGESTIDIYKYQRFFREGKIDEPMPHLFIISDEFAELKSQQPEFMNDLISAARIGRSLGVHLILATQKPSGVVNDQIWSNTKFRVCLKVQDKSDSNEMLKRPDAAEITNAGRFYLQVGNDEIFVLGQSGWAGTQYVANDSVKKKYDRSISFIDDVGSVIKNLEETKEVQKVEDNGDELSNIMKYICSMAAKENVKARNLWLDAIPADIYVDDIVKKYNYTNSNVVTAVIGEYDAPSKQYQDILTLTLDDEGNTLVYGASGTNREMFVSSFIYSLCTTYMPEDINIYIADFGSESLRMYEKFPQVGDIVYASEKDKLIKLFSIVDEEIQYRKKLFADYNGEYKNYIKNSGQKLPLKIIIINNYDSFKESYSSLEDILIKLTREGERYGILFMISATNSRSIYSKIYRNFHHTFVLDMPDKGDYIDILGKIGNVYPASFDGRGLYRNDEVYEFQTAQVTNPDNLIEFVKAKIKLVTEKCNTKAPSIPVLPEVVTIDMLDKFITDINNLPIGIIKRTLKPMYYNFFNDKATILSSKDVKNCKDFLQTVIYGVRKLGNMVVLIDTEKELTELGGTVNTYADQNFEEFILKFEQFLDAQIDGKDIKVLCIIAGLEKFQGSLNDKKFNGFFNGIKTLPNLNLMFVDSSFKLKKVGFETWYSSNTNNANGIWIGQGFMEQTVISANDYNNKFKEKIDKQFAWVSKNGEAELIKIVGEKEKEDEE